MPRFELCRVNELSNRQPQCRGCSEQRNSRHSLGIVLLKILEKGEQSVFSLERSPHRVTLRGLGKDLLFDC